MSENEEVLGIFPILLKKGWTPDAYDLVFTTDRLLVAKRNKLGSQRPEYIAFSASAHDRLKMRDVSPDFILKADSRNFGVAYSDITVVDLKGKDFMVYMGDLDVPKYKFKLFMKSQYLDDVFAFLHQVLPGKI